MQVDKLIKKYDYIINFNVKKYMNFAKNLGLESDDLYQEGLLALINSLNNYNKEKDAQFKTYASSVIEHQIKDYLKINDKNNHIFLNEAIIGL